MGGCQNYGPFLGPYYNTAPNIVGCQKGTIILTTTLMNSCIFSTQPWRIEANTFAQALRWVPLNGAVSAKQLQWLEEFEGEVEGVRCREERDRRTEDKRKKQVDGRR